MRFSIAPPGVKRLALKRSGIISGIGKTYEVLDDAKQADPLKSPVVKAFFEDDDLQLMDVTSTNIGIHYSYQKWFDRGEEDGGPR